MRHLLPACCCPMCSNVPSKRTQGRYRALGRCARAGPLGQGICNAVGLAAAEAHLAARFNKPDATIVDHYT